MGELAPPVPSHPCGDHQAEPRGDALPDQAAFHLGFEVPGVDEWKVSVQNGYVFV